MKLHRCCRHASLLSWAILGVASLGCAYFPETRHREALHNPFPQLKRVAILPFFNQSSEPTVDGDQVAESYYAALQAIPGFEVLPIGVAKAQWLRHAMVHGEPRSGADFQQLAREMGVEAVVVGSVTDYDPYYPPRMAMTVHWYAANEGFHTIPAGYGLPWGTDAEKQIPRRIAREAEFELARSQLATQTPLMSSDPALLPQPPAQPPNPDSGSRPSEPDSASSYTPTRMASHNDASRLPANGLRVQAADGEAWFTEAGEPIDVDPALLGEFSPPLPANWPDSTDLIPDPPAPTPPPLVVNHEPVLSHTRLYRGDDLYFTNRLADYVETGDDARPGGWQDYLKRSDDFIRFCCHLHVTEMLESRGGREQSELILRWPLSRY